VTSASFDGERIDWLRLARSEAIGATTFAYLIRRFGSATAALAEAPSLARRGGRETPLRLATRAEAEREIAAGEALGARLMLGCEADFPRLLAVLDAPPPLIWTLGDSSLLNHRLVAIVGARAASAAGRRMARNLAAGLGAAGLVVVSGLARGIDAAAHEGALATGTAAVLAGGIDDIYPPEHAELAAAIAGNGCLVSERPPGFTARAKDFPRRNRIISGLSLGVVVVEAELRSGSLITARLAGEQGRDVFAVPGSPLDPRARGANDLLRQGAYLVEEVDDVLRALGPSMSLDAFEPPPAGVSEPEDLGPADQARIESLLSDAPISLDDLAREAGVSAGATAAVIVELALAGRAELLPGGLAISAR
jgi:DNA processing protein